jgi:hypothetical protein
MKTYGVTLSVVCLDTLEVEVAGMAIGQGDCSVVALLQAVATVIPDLPGVDNRRGQAIADALATIAAREASTLIVVPGR